MKVVIGFVIGTVVNTAFVIFLEWANGYIIPSGLLAQVSYPTGGWLSLLVIMIIVYTGCLWGVYVTAWGGRKTVRVCQKIFRRADYR